MGTLVLLALERHGRLIPICRSRHPEVVQAVAQAAFEEAQAAAACGDGDEIFEALLRQEADRLRKALTVLGLMPFDPDGGSG